MSECYCVCCVQVFQYDGAKKCTDGDYMPFYVIGMLLVVFFVFPAPFAIGYICARRPRVSLCVDKVFFYVQVGAVALC